MGAHGVRAIAEIAPSATLPLSPKSCSTLTSDRARFVTGGGLVLDAGLLTR